MAASTPGDLHRLFEEHFNEGDLDGLAALYERDARLAAEPGRFVAGERAIRAALEPFLASDATMTLDTTAVVEVADVALLHNEWRLKATGADGRPFGTTGRAADVVRRQADGRWLFVIDNPWAAVS